MGLLILLPAWQGLVLLKQWPLANGLIIAVMVLVWGADIGAYFSGKAFGKRKLAPRVSPGRAGEGVYGGLAASLAITGGRPLPRLVPRRAAPGCSARRWWCSSRSSATSPKACSSASPESGRQPAARPRWRAGSHRQPDGSHPGIRGPALGRRLECAMSRPQRISVLGATGIGLSTLDVVQRHPDRYEAFALTGFQPPGRTRGAVPQAPPRLCGGAGAGRGDRLAGSLAAAGIRTRVLFGEQALCEVASAPEVDMVMAAIVGAAGLPSTLAAVEAEARTAGQQALVMSGALFMQAVKRSGAVLLPIDSEHNAIFQSLPRNYADGLERVGVRRILLTASGGPFRETPLEQLASVTPEQACVRTRTVDGAEDFRRLRQHDEQGARTDRGVLAVRRPAEPVEVVIHPQSVIHSMVDYVDGSVIAQLGNRTCARRFPMPWPGRANRFRRFAAGHVRRRSPGFSAPRRAALPAPGEPGRGPAAAPRPC